MKLFFGLVVSISLFSSSYACGDKEAQVIMKVVGVETDSLMTCKAKVTMESISVFNHSLVCPLSIEEVIDEGVDFPLINGHDCEVPDNISGVLVKRNNKIFLD